MTEKFTYLQIFLAFIEEMKISETFENLLIRLEIEKWAYEIFHISKILLSFENEKINQKVVSILMSKKEDWDWGNWSEHFRNELKK